MRIIIAILLLLFPISCSHIGYITDTDYNIEIKPFIQSFESHCKCKINIPVKIEKIKIKEKGYTTLGICYGFRMPILFRSVVIDSDYWAKADFYEKESTVFHELAHCVLNLGHTEEMTGDYIFIRPKSIMYPYSFYQYQAYRKEYIKELFSRKPGPLSLD